MSDLAETILAALDAKSDDVYWLYRATVEALLELHQQSETHVWPVPRDPSGEPDIQLNSWCKCQERDGIAEDEGEWPCPTLRAIAEKLGVEVDPVA